MNKRLIGLLIIIAIILGSGGALYVGYQLSSDPQNNQELSCITGRCSLRGISD